MMMSSISKRPETVADNEDLIIEILLRVPVKPLLKFKSVSKAWRSIISSPRFIRLHTLRNSNSVVSGFFLRRNPSQFQFLSLNTNQVSPIALNFTHGPSGIKILQSCNGLLLCSSRRKHTINCNYYVYNPTTNSFFTLPPLAVDENKVAIFGVYLAFDPSQSLSYKVVCVRSTEKSMNFYQIEIYESDFGAWRLSGSPFVAPFGTEFYNGVFWNDSIHWINHRGEFICFDMKIECLKDMPYLPLIGPWWGGRRVRHLVESNGYLHLIEIYGPCSSRFKIFEMEKDYSEWFVRYDICLDEILTAYPGMLRSYFGVDHYVFVPFFVVREENGASVLLHIPGKILSYNVVDKTFKQLLDFDAATEKAASSLQFGWLDSYPYFQSLVPV